MDINNARTTPVSNHAFGVGMVATEAEQSATASWQRDVMTIPTPSILAGPVKGHKLKTRAFLHRRFS